MNSPTITTVNPATGATLRSYQACTPVQVDEALQRGHAAAAEWGRTPLPARVAVIRRVAQQLRDQSRPLAALVTEEMGKPLAEAAGEVEKSAVTALYYADHAEKILADEPVHIDGANAWVSYEPVGLVLAVMPWNFPVWQVMRFVLPSLTAGNGVILKHSPNVSGCALALQQLLLDAGLPEAVFTTLLIAEADVPATVERLIGDERIAAVTLTGSNRAGAMVGAAAGRAAKKSVLELGGSDAFIVLDGADLQAAAKAAVKARYSNAGQSCVCAKRFIVAASVAQAFTELFVDGVRALVTGDPTQAATQVGPLARVDLRGVLQDQVERSIAAGAVLLAGGQAMPGDGYFYQPTVLGQVTPGMAVFDEETFGPVAAISIASDDEDVVQLANASQFGLSVSIWSPSTQRALALARRITTGAAFINAITASDARLPFGGTKKSGYGRELAAAGVREFSNIRTYWCA
ncbi:aldehyde dehydrogenase family protein [Janthinobacterium sp.]|uniref:aldehyde dehydrogenase family protein n=1 Tax=Janthinobacterium sp. TaxID=1871054 RepID=UPI00260F3847|nr:aldehyde dehydrogenase family protein [Janthinobacterium sp.]